ncbi:MAG: glutamate--tRNA ligase [Bacteroidota bacterium]|nr:glutamate--tRNA ligase [Candidatus Kapabacteria bacterium]MCS7302688.1 glutamate--tRNA ligase [Candidatus Kapabacteria bacterium]MCX7936196.1 glutamate--tRNA ligase [Chlorobiota bacterium]MDW8074910.1 glutamate--tRNA ligase [Bacteroidota bacterium]MDW8271549.1 glutamate--tRNA ligase [Bacteroidota bacterium]
MSVRVRFAPSPTGFLHIGGLRTALYNYLFARHHGGRFILRIEDTDRTRYVPGSVEDILESLRWAGIEPDESPVHGGDFGPYVQSQRTEIYRQHAQLLLERGTAYYAFDTPEELERMRQRQQAAGIAPHYDRSSMRNQFTLGPEETKRLLEAGEAATIRLKVPLHGEVKFHDLIRGTIVVPCKDIDDQVLLKSDGFPTYHLANVVDDHLMQITHVIRGEEWLPSTAKHVLLYEAFGWETPQFAHLPLLLNPDRSKLSKRHGDVAVRDYIAKGYFPEAIVNFIALLGWNPSSDRELYTLDELISAFSLERVNKAGAVFDLAKLDWMNAQYLKQRVQRDLQGLVASVRPLLEERGWSASDEYIGRVIVLVHERIHRLPELVEFADYMFTAPHYDEALFRTTWDDTSEELLVELSTLLAAIEPFTAHALQERLNAFAKERNIPFRRIGSLLRLAITGKSVGPGMMDTMALLGKDVVLDRIRNFLEWTRTLPHQHIKEHNPQQLPQHE